MSPDLGFVQCSQSKKIIIIIKSLFYRNAAFTNAGLTTRYRTESLQKSIFVLSRSHVM